MGYAAKGWQLHDTRIEKGGVDLNFATIGAVFADGVTLIFDGETSAGAKHYKVNTACQFNAGDRVKICEDSGTYIVEYPIGNPQSGGGGTDAATLNGKKESELSVANAAKLGNKTESELSVQKSQKLINFYYPDTPQYDLFFKTDYNGNIYYKIGEYGAWKKIANA